MYRPLWRNPGLKPGRALLLLVVGVLITWWMVALGMNWRPHRHTPALLKAAQTMERALTVVGNLAQERGVLDPTSDLHRTGFIGGYFTPLTTTVGSLPAKRTSVQPDMAALLTRQLIESGVEPGDTVLISASSSFPGLVTAALIAVETIGAKHRTVVSLGSSQWGANQPELPWPDMERALVDSGLLQQGALLYTPGGMEDRLHGHLWEREYAMQVMEEAAGARWYVPESLQDAIDKRLQIFLGEQRRADEGVPALLVSIGGSQATLGTCITAPPSGTLIEDPLPCNGMPGVVHHLLDMGIPVFHLLNIVDLAHRHGVAVDPAELPELGTAGVYFDTAPRPLSVLLGVVAGIVSLVLARPPVRRRSGERGSSFHGSR